MENLIELSQLNKPVGRVTDVRNGSIMEFATFMNPRDEEDLSKGYRFSSKFTHTYPVEEEKAGRTATTWKEKKSFSDNDFLRMRRLSGKADDLDQALRQQLKEELKATATPKAAASTPVTPSL